MHRKKSNPLDVLSRFIVAIFAIAGLQVPMLFAPAGANDGTLDLNYGEMSFLPEADLTEANANLSVGFNRRYSDVVDIGGSKVDALVTITYLQHRSELNSFDEYDNSKHLSFHTAITGTSSERTMGRLRVDFLAAGTNTPVVIRNIRASVADIDSWEFAEFKDISSYKFANPTDLYVGMPAVTAGYTQFLSSRDGTSNTEQTRIVEVSYDAASSISFQMGCKTGAVSQISTGGRCGFTVTIGTLMLTGQTSETSVAAPSYTLTYDANLGTAGTVPGETTATGPHTISANTGNLTKEDLVFAGWNTAADGTGLDLAPSAIFVPQGNTTLYAKYAAAQADTSGDVVRTVTYLANGGTGSMAAQTSATTDVLRSNTFDFAGHTFAGWNTQPDGSGTVVADASSYDFQADMTLFAQWTPLPPATTSIDSGVASTPVFTVKYSPNGGAGSMADQISGTPLQFLANTFVREGWIFSGWNTSADGSGTAYPEKDTYNFQADLELFAQWLPEPEPIVESVGPEDSVLAETGAGAETAYLSLAAALLIGLGSWLLRFRRRRA